MTGATAIERRVGGRKAILESVVRQLITFDERAEGSYVTTPLLYPSGASVVVRVDGGPERFMVSDSGIGYHEADLIGATQQFVRHARSVADNAGVGFDQHAFFVLEVNREQLPGAIVIIANCTQEAVLIASFKLAEKSKSDAAELLFDRLVSVFDRHAVTKNADVVGNSGTVWPVVALVKVAGRIAIFESVNYHYISIVNAAAKLNDIANTDEAPSRNVVVDRKKPFGTYLNLLSKSASVLERSDPDETFRRQVAA